MEAPRVRPDRGAALCGETRRWLGGLLVKAAVDELTERWLRVDYLIMTTVDEDFVPEVLGWLEPEDGHPVLLIEDLSGAHWPTDHWPLAMATGTDGDLARDPSAVGGDTRARVVADEVGCECGVARE